MKIIAILSLFFFKTTFLYCASVKTTIDTTKKAKPIVADAGMADPHIHIFNNKAYLYATRDGDKTAKNFIMPDWKIWTSSDLIAWKLETTIEPSATYMGKSDNCWAPDLAYKNGNFYFYFSDGNVNTGVMVGETPVGPFKDALGKPLLPQNLTPIKEYDPTVLIDDDPQKTAYIAFGHFRASDPTYYYMIAKLGNDMISLAEKPKKLEITGTAEGFNGNDKPTLHKREGLYYLSAGTSYAVSENIYGPYTRRGHSAFRDEYGLNNAAHGNFFEWNNQWFHTWCHFYLGKEIARYRQSYLNYLHYKDNGDMVDDTVYLDKHGNVGVGQYDADWDKIEAEWYMASNGIQKKEKSKDGGFSIQKIQNSGYLYFPNVKNIKPNSRIIFNVAGLKSGTIEVRTGNVKGAIIGLCQVKNTGSLDKYQDVTCEVKNLKETENLYFVFRGDAGDLFNIDYFKFQ